MHLFHCSYVHYELYSTSLITGGTYGLSMYTVYVVVGSKSEKENMYTYKICTYICMYTTDESYMGLEGGLSQHACCFMHAMGFIVCHACSNEGHELVRSCRLGLKSTYVRTCMIEQRGMYLSIMISHSLLQCCMALG